jgi:iron-sulfur cluster assembly protein
MADPVKLAMNAAKMASSNGSTAVADAPPAHPANSSEKAGQPSVKPSAKGIQVTGRALEHIRIAMQKEGIAPQEGGLRLGVQGGGCSGLTYNIRFDTQPRERDRIFQFEDVRVFVDPKSYIYLHGMVLDWEDSLMKQGFNFINPNSQKSCGCGTSFSG